MAFSVIAIAGSALVGGAVSLLSFGPGTGDFITQGIYDFLPLRIAAVQDLTRALQKGDLSKTEYESLMRKTGFDIEAVKHILSASASGLSVREIITLWFRFKESPTVEFPVNETWLKERMLAAAVTPNKVTELIEANRPVPTLDDIIRFAVRDVFEEDVVKLGKLDEGLPDEFVKESAMRGMSDKDTKFFWRSHWVFPSLNQSFEMFHRLFDNPNPDIRFTRKEMDVLFNVADIAPAMRDRLQAIAFRPVGRVDIRRFDALGIFGVGAARQQKLTRAYRELGFSPETAANQTEFTIRLNDKDDKEFSRSQILELFRSGLPREETRKAAETALLGLGFTEDKIKLMLDLEDLKLIDAAEQASIDTLVTQFANGIISTEAELRTKLATVALSPKQIISVVSDAKKARDTQSKRVSISTADKLLLLGIIPEQEWKDIYRFHGIIPKDIEAVLKLLERPSGSESRQPSKDDIIGWLSAGLIDTTRFQELMRDIGFDDEFISLYALQAGQEINT